ARVISMPGIEEGMLRQGGLATDWAKIHEVVRRTARRLRGAREVHLTSAAGTDLSFSLEGRDWISEDTGLCTRKGTVTTLPAGELFIAVVEGSASGRLVVDAHFGFGDNLVIGGKIHPGVRVECILSEVRVEVDGKAVIEKGRLVE